MTEILSYLLISSLLLACFYLIYLSIFQDETYFKFNRFFLLGIVFFSVAIPLIDFSDEIPSITIIDQPISNLNTARKDYISDVSLWLENNIQVSKSTLVKEDLPSQSVIFDIEMIFRSFFVIYLLGVFYHLVKFLTGILGIYSLIRKNHKELINNVIWVKMPEITTPFSFLNYVFISEKSLDDQDFNQILSHEKIHVTKKHSIDLLLVQLVANFLWFNPLMWRLIESIKTNHEYEVDYKMINQGYSLVEYQKLLLNQLISNNSFGLVHNFNLSFIKKRITMMTKKQSTWIGKLKIGVSIPIILMFAFVFIKCNDPKVLADAPQLADATSSYLPNLKYTSDLPENFDWSQSLELKILNDRIYMNGKEYSLFDLEAQLNNIKLNQNTTVVAKVGANEKMQLVDQVFNVFREANLRKFLMIGNLSNDDDKPAYIKMLLPPPDYYKAGSIISRENVLKTKEHLLKINLEGPLRLDKEYISKGELEIAVGSFIEEQIKISNSDYVIMALHGNETAFESFIENYALINNAFNEKFNERSQDQFQLNYDELEPNQSALVRKGLPRAIMINNVDYL